MPLERVATWQKEMVALCEAAGKPVVVATQMLDSMQDSPATSYGGPSMDVSYQPLGVLLWTGHGLSRPDICTHFTLCLGAG